MVWVLDTECIELVRSYPILRMSIRVLCRMRYVMTRRDIARYYKYTKHTKYTKYTV